MPPRSEGERLLRADARSLRALAEAVGVSNPSILRYRTGRQVPTMEVRAAMEAELQIPASAWDLAPGASKPDAGPLLPPSAGRGTTLELARARVEELRTMRVDAHLSVDQRMRVADAETRAAALVARLEQAAELLETRSVRASPFFRRATKVLLAALKPFPDASRAVVAAFAEHDVDPTGDE